MSTLKQRIDDRREKIETLWDELAQCNANIEAEKQRKRELARQYNNLYGSLGFLLDTQ